MSPMGTAGGPQTAPQSLAEPAPSLPPPPIRPAISTPLAALCARRTREQIRNDSFRSMSVEPIGIVKICTIALSNYPASVTTARSPLPNLCLAVPSAESYNATSWWASVFSLDCNAVHVKPSGASNALSPSREPEKYLSQFLTTAALSTWLYQPINRFASAAEERPRIRATYLRATGNGIAWHGP